MLVSGSVENSYTLFGIRETQVRDRLHDNVEVQAIESTTVIPQFEKFAPGLRAYTLFDWDDLGLDAKGINSAGLDIMGDVGGFDSQPIYPRGIVPVLHELYLAIQDFNPDDKERSHEDKNGGVKILSYRTGELVLLTMAPNKGGWFEGYRFNDPDRLCGLGHLSTLKKVNFK